MSAAEVQQTALDAQGQGAEGMDGMARLGGTGEHPQNCHRALMNLLGIPSGAPNFYWAMTPTTAGDATPSPLPSSSPILQPALQRESDQVEFYNRWATWRCAGVLEDDEGERLRQAPPGLAEEQVGCDNSSCDSWRWCILFAP